MYNVCVCVHPKGVQRFWPKMPRFFIDRAPTPLQHPATALCVLRRNRGNKVAHKGWWRMHQSCSTMQFQWRAEKAAEANERLDMAKHDKAPGGRRLAKAAASAVHCPLSWWPDVQAAASAVHYPLSWWPDVPNGEHAAGATAASDRAKVGATAASDKAFRGKARGAKASAGATAASDKGPRGKVKATKWVTKRRRVPQRQRTQGLVTKRRPKREVTKGQMTKRERRKPEELHGTVHMQEPLIMVADVDRVESCASCGERCPLSSVVVA